MERVRGEKGPQKKKKKNGPLKIEAAERRKYRHRLCSPEDGSWKRQKS